MAHRSEMDECTKYIVFGFIRQIESLLLYDNNNCAYFNIPHEISDLCLSYVSDHFMLHIGTYKWTISDRKRFKEMTSASNKQQFVSNEFEIGRLKWIVQAYPNGIDEDSIGLFDIFVKLLSLPPKWDHIIVRRTIECIESASKYTCIATYEKDSSFGWCDGALSLKEVSNFKQLTFIIRITILRIQLVENRIFYQICNKNEDRKVYNIEWKINKALMDKMKQSNTGKCYESNIEKEGLFCIQCFPNGDNAASKGDVELYIQLCSLPSNISKLEIEYSLSCVETKSKDRRVKEFDYDNDQSAKWSHDVLSFQLFKKYDSVTFEADILIKNKYDLKGDLLCDTQSDWNWYLKQKKYFQEISDAKKQKHNSYRKELQCIKSQITQLLSIVNELKINNNCCCCGCDGDGDGDEHNHCIVDGENNLKLKDINQNALYLWLKDTVRLEQYYYVFVKNGFDDLDSIKYLSMNELDSIGIDKLGHKLKLLDYIQQKNIQ